MEELRGYYFSPSY